MTTPMKVLQSPPIKLYRPTRTFFHRVQVIYYFKNSDYVYRTFKVFFNSVRHYLIYGEVPKRFKNANYPVWLLRGWSLYDNVVIGKKRFRYGILHRRTGLAILTNGPLDERKFGPAAWKPLTIYFHGEPWKDLATNAHDEFSDAAAFKYDSGLGPEPTVIQISKRWDKNDPRKIIGTTVSIFFTGDPREDWDIKIIDYIFSFLYRPVHWRGVAERELVRVEQFVRIRATAKYKDKDGNEVLRLLEEEFSSLLEDLKKRYAVPTDDTTQKHGRKEDLIYENPDGVRRKVDKINRAIDLRFQTGYRVDLKIYRKKKFKLPEEHYTDHPKIEVVHYHIKWEDLEAVIREGAKILASVVEALDMRDFVIDDPDHPVSAEVVGDVFLVSSFKRLVLRNKLEMIPPFLRAQMHELRLRLLQELLTRNLKSADLKKFEKEWGVPIRTIRYHMKKLREAGLVTYVPTRNNQYLYVLNTDALSASAVPEPAERAEFGGQLDFSEAEVKAAMVEFERRIKDVQRKANVFKTYLLVRVGINTSKAIAKVLGVTPRQVRNYLEELRKTGLVERRAMGRARIYVPADYESVLRASAETLGAEDSSLGLGSEVLEDGSVGEEGLGVGGQAAAARK
uniref:Rep n=2 Tax=Thermococcus sp. AMT11 TaxID=563043 RepID=C8BNE0_9EURY|nr:Rep [Thermococcus sp. AMT11]